jgi:hypothetical protein
MQVERVVVINEPQTVTKGVVEVAKAMFILEQA